MSDDDNILWHEYTRSVLQLDNSNKYVSPLRELNYSISHSELGFLRQQQQLINSVSFGARDLIPFSRKQKKRFKSEARLDLHDVLGDIDKVLVEFCTRCMIKKIRYITIITGKGGGILREKVTRWLRSHTQFISEYFEIVDSSNACGSLGVHLKCHRNNR